MNQDINKVEEISIKAFGKDEKWLQDYIWKNPSHLGLGDEVTGVYKERIQSSGSRLDMLLVNKDTETMYEVEIMLGETDESHIIRAIEYWEYERSKWPSMKHVCVLVAEKITSRFYNVIRLLSNSVPTVGIQVNIQKINNEIGISFTKLVDTTESQEIESHIDNIQITKEQFIKEYGFLWDTAENLRNIALDSKIDFDPRHVSNYVSVRMNGKDRLWIDPRKNNESCITIYTPEENREQLLNLINSVSYQVRESSGNKVYFRIKSESFKNKRSDLAMILSLL